MTSPLALHFSITGRVQGVGYRRAMEREALRLGLAGWVRNRRDGSVEALASGPAEAVRELEAWARRGPRLAEVQEVVAEPWNGDPPQGEFLQLPTC